MPLDRSRKPYTTSVKNVAAQTHFHRVEELEAPDDFERMLSDIESDAVSVIQRFHEARFPLAVEDREKFSFYIALQAVRGPDTRKTFERLRAEMVRLEVGAGGRRNVEPWVKKNLGFAPTDDQADRIWTDATQRGGPPIAFSNLAHLHHMINMAARITSTIAARPWVLVRFGSPSLITSDAPVALIRNPKHEPWQGVGFETAWGIMFPLTRMLGLLMGDPMVVIERFEPGDPRIQTIRAAVLRGEADRLESGTAEIVELFNWHTARRAREYVYHHPDDLTLVPDDLPEPNLITVDLEGFGGFDFDGIRGSREPEFTRRPPRTDEARNVSRTRGTTTYIVSTSRLS